MVHFHDRLLVLQYCDHGGDIFRAGIRRDGVGGGSNGTTFPPHCQQPLNIFAYLFERAKRKRGLGAGGFVRRKLLRGDTLGLSSETLIDWVKY